MLKQSETLNILPIAQDSVFVYWVAPLASISSHPRADPRGAYFTCSKNAGIRVTNVAETRRYLLREET